MDAREMPHRSNALVPTAQALILPEKDHMLVGLTRRILQPLRGDA
jgi:hypothetical protein